MPEHQAIYGLELGKLWKKIDMKKVSGWLNALVFLEQWRGPTAATSPHRSPKFVKSPLVDPNK